MTFSILLLSFIKYFLVKGRHIRVLIITVRFKICGSIGLIYVFSRTVEIITVITLVLLILNTWKSQILKILIFTKNIIRFV